LISWKDSFEKINNELDLAKRKQNALEELHANGKISQFTYENLNRAITAEIEQIEARRKDLAEKMTSKLNELEKQISTLETFLANVEMSYAAGEITEEIHSQEVSALNLGLEATKNELNFIKEAIMQLVPEETQAELAAAVETPETVEETPTETAMETMPEVSETTQIETATETSATEETSVEEQPIETTETFETPEVHETPVETPTETTTEETTEATTEETTKQTALETPTEEMPSEEQEWSETSAEGAPLEEPETSEVSETSTEETQPFPEEGSEIE
jgi:hypothetical protein